jgi:hypothetical protein
VEVLIMSKRMLERIAVLMLSIVMLLSSTGIVSSLAANVSESSTMSATSSTSSSTETSASTEVSQEGGAVTTTAVTEEGGTPQTVNNGDGTVSNPYKISTAEDFLAIQEKINSAADANKNFILTNDIDLSGVSAADFSANGGSLISVNKALSEKSSNVFVSLNGDGYKLTGLNVSLGTNSASVFGYLSSGSVVKNVTVSKAVINATGNMNTAAILAAENDGTIENVFIEYPTLTLKSCVYAGLVAAVNNGTISDVTVKSGQTNAGAATDTSYTVLGSGSIGAVAGINSGKITSVSSINIGAYLTADSENIYGGIAGKNSGTISDSVSTGNVTGGKSTDSAGGIVGQAVAPSGKEKAESVLINDYTLVSITSAVWGCGVIGSAGTADMMKDCYWSSAVSGKDQMCTNYGTGINDISGLTYKVVNVGSSAKISASDIKNAWGKASFTVTSGFSLSGSGVELKSDSSSATIKGVTANSVSYVKYTSNIMLPASVGAGSGSVTVSQYFRIAAVVVPSGTAGDGSASAPLEISSGAEFNLLRYVNTINVKLVKDIVYSGSTFVFCGTLDGNGHTLKAGSKVMSTVYGTVKNLNVLVTSNLTNAVFGNAINAKFSSVSVNTADGVSFEIAYSISGAFFDYIIGSTTVDDCRVNVNINIVADNISKIGGFAGGLVGNPTITNSGANAVITTSKSGAASVAAFIGFVSSDAQIKNCYAAGTNSVTNYLFIGDLETDKLNLENIYWSNGSSNNAAQSPVNFDKYEKVIPKSAFTQWSFDNGASAFFTGNGGNFAATLPSITALKVSSASDFSVNCDSSKLTASVTVENGKVILHVNRADGVITVKDSLVALTNKLTGLTSYISVSNGLEKDSSGNYIVSTGYDLAYIGENIENFSTASFVVSNDIDMSVIANFAPIGGTTAAFAGTFNGNGHTIANLTINGTSKVGLFATLNGATVKNIVFKNANVTSAGSYAAILAGQAIGNSVISGITVESSRLSASDTYSALIIGSANGSDGFAVTNINIKNSSVISTANYVGAIAGRIYGYANISGIKIDGFTASGAAYVAGAVGMASNAEKINLNNISAAGLNISGVSYVAGIIGSGDNNVYIDTASVENSKISTLGTASAYVAGGIAASFSSAISNASVKSVSLSAGTVGGIVGSTLDSASLTISNSKVISSSISASDANTFAGGILGVHHATGSVAITGCTVSEDTTINSAAISAGIVADVSTSDGKLSIVNTTSFATVKGCENENAIAAAGVLGRIGASSVNAVSLDGVKVSGKISGRGALGGLIGLIKNGEVFKSGTPLVNKCIAVSQIKASDAESESTAGMIIGAVENNKVLTDSNIDSAVTGVVISTYFGSTNAYSSQSGLSGNGFYDMDKPNGSSIKSDIDTLNNSTNTKVTISNLPTLSGYTFDGKTGWVSESAARIEVLESTQNSAILKANHKADISIVAYYTLDSDPSFRVPVHFQMVSKIRTPLNGSGTADSPYLISNAFELEAVAEYAADGANFALSKDITFEASDFEFGGAFYNVGNGIVTIGDATCGFKGTFTGLYNGTVHSINGLKLTGNVFGGLFGATDGAVISDIIINNPNVTGLNYAGVLVGSAKNTVIKNITINNAQVNTTQADSLAGAVAGYAENVTIENVKVNTAKISTTLNGSSATVESAGGVAGIFSGSIKDSAFSNMSVISGTIAGGLIGAVKGEKTEVSIKNISVYADVSGYMAGGAIGKIHDPLGLTIDGLSIGGTVKAEKYGAGVIANMSAGDSGYSVDKLTSPMLKDVVCASTVVKADTNAVIIANVSTAVFGDKENSNTSVFENVYYSSYQDDMPIFGTGEINAYQNDEYKVTDLNSVRFVSGGYESKTIPLNEEFKTLSPDSFVIDGVNGNYQSFTVGSTVVKLKNITSNVDGLVTYDSNKSAVKLNSVAPADSKLVLVYDNGLELAIGIGQASALQGSGTKDDPYRITDADTFEVLAANGSAKDVYYVLTNDISLVGLPQINEFAGILDGNGKVLYDYTGLSLFKKVSGTIMNLGFAGFNISDNSGSPVGAVAGVLDGANVKNCFVIANVNAEAAKQDAGILAGQMINSSAVSSCVTSGKVTGKTLASGGIVGAAENSTISYCTSTAYVAGANAVGGIVGNAAYSKISNVVFANMAETFGGVAGNIVGINEKNTSTVESTYFDSLAAKVTAFSGSGDAQGKAVTTEGMTTLAIEGFASTGGYPIPSSLNSNSMSAMFKTGVGFAAMTIRYLSGLNTGSVYNYTDIKVDTTVNGNTVSLNRTDSGLVLTLMPNTDYSTAKNTVSRYAVPAAVSAVSVSYDIIDATSDGSVGNQLTAVLLKSKAGENANAFDLFTTANAEPKVIDGVAIADGKMYANLVLPSEYSFSVTAIDENGAKLEVTNNANEGFAIAIGTAKSVSLTFTIENNSDSSDWGVRSIWGSIGK